MGIEIGYLGIVICLLDIQERQFHIEQYPHEWNGLRPVYFDPRGSKGKTS